MMEVFISHADKDKEPAIRFKTELESVGATVNLLTYEIDPNKTVIEKIKRGIKSCDLGLILWTKNSRNSEWVIQEVGALAILDKPIFVILDKKTLPPRGMAEGKHYLKLDDETSIGRLKEWVSNETVKKSTQNFVLAVVAILIGIGISSAIFSLFKK